VESEAGLAPDVEFRTHSHGVETIITQGRNSLTGFGPHKSLNLKTLRVHLHTTFQVFPAPSVL
jgi:hypothetical protein